MTRGCLFEDTANDVQIGPIQWPLCRSKEGNLKGPVNEQWKKTPSRPKLFLWTPGRLSPGR